LGDNWSLYQRINNEWRLIATYIDDNWFQIIFL
jgi:hypothetical protein